MRGLWGAVRRLHEPRKNSMQTALIIEPSATPEHARNADWWLFFTAWWGGRQLV